ncbi:HicB family protein [Thiocapsa imhoffii]|uniref:HicB family protein n=1 Tax=Thiocapsa imhoffii TaxID=382777 RepID=A0A9X0WLG0_9GAMM|nr:type II toxin-antitoxin system HicB family antitoxin [Thiocapsa imhoffii]MBK1646936.1 HicB family protein [Thiocapsa imhoffii]
MKYKVALRKTDEGFSVSCPGLPGCWSQGKTEQEALENIADAINEYVDVSAELAATEDTEMREVEVAA